MGGEVREANWAVGGQGAVGSGQGVAASWPPGDQEQEPPWSKSAPFKGKKYFLRFIDNGLILSNPGKYKICDVKGSLLPSKAVICFYRRCLMLHFVAELCDFSRIMS